ncbi:MAG: YhcH/YjgK/YiaL family protein [Candidatus Riflebacteria bacterium]|nr:YhcH/YjgK/YiaL family protein [Candidatus Riflebacteria bacterium]
MIINRLERAENWFVMGKRIKHALQYLRTVDPETLSPGRHELEGDRLFAMIQEYETKPIEKGFWETHRRYIDVQFVAKGVERIGWADADAMHEGPYDESKDLIVLQGKGDFLTVRPGTFLILGPRDAHMPCISPESGPGFVKKIVVKVQIED